MAFPTATYTSGPAWGRGTHDNGRRTFIPWEPWGPIVDPDGATPRATGYFII